jgi:hypothetical protein
MQITQEERRARIVARPRINTRERGDYESWYRRAFVLYADIVRMVGEEPADEVCERWGRRSACRRRPCDPCYERGEWEEGVLAIVREATDWSLWGSGHGVEGCPGRPYADEPHVYRHAKHRKVVVVSWSGGLDI